MIDTHVQPDDCDPCLERLGLRMAKRQRGKRI